MLVTPPSVFPNCESNVAVCTLNSCTMSLGGTFAAPRPITPKTGDSDDMWPRTLIMSPETGLPEFVYQVNVPNTDPLDTDVWRAYLVAEEGSPP